jgi:hypothetical protein
LIRTCLAGALCLLAAPTIAVTALADSAIEILCGAWTRTSNYLAVRRGLLADVKTRFDAAGIAIPYPQRDVHVPGQRALLDVAAEINEGTELTLSGWIAGLAAPSALEIQAELTKLQLATYSPYAAAFAGMPLDGGRLDAVADLEAAAGNLEGELRLEIDQIAYLIERGGIDAARITECRATFDPTDQRNPRAEVLF